MGKKLADGTQRSTFVRHGKLRRSKSWSNALRILLTTAIVVVLSGVATVSYAVWGLAKDIRTVELAGGPNGVGAGAESIDGALTILLVGSDSRQGQAIDDGEEGELNDVNLMLHVSADHQNATVVSFPRDLMVPFPSCPGPNGEPEYYSPMSEQQLNSAMMYGGLPCVAATLSELTGMPIPYAGLVTFDGVIGISNALGGVDVCLAQPIVDPNADLDLPAGMNNLVGMDALQFLRTRHGVGDGGDTSRISNQQIFMSAMLRKLKDGDTLSDPVKVYGLAKAGVENMTLSSNMASVQFMQSVAGTVKDIDLERINFVQYPSSSHPYEKGRLTPNYLDAETLFEVIQSGQPFEVASVGEGVEVEGEGDPAVDPATDPAVDPAAEPDPAVDPATDPAVDPAAEPDPAVDPATDPAAEPAPVEDSGPIKLPENITGQQASSATCSLGRTVF
ncbi:LCP family protein required for cell wall assembly [Leucobacter exalbidus]|uniref:LCP family protein required for cell wall assembly n=1 Tax=Leucobacter exalbidus TaxID=662960 RepID=A0A940PU07_9MICO|nr:LCP family protein [Leucobacter exalbidus]MBP1326788.1 LCP family protein required for cell wall assembly [Leucobacter exalbidus]